MIRQDFFVGILLGRGFYFIFKFVKYEAEELINDCRGFTTITF